MNPTEFFRFIKRSWTHIDTDILIRPFDEPSFGEGLVLQQWWEGEKMIPGGGGGEWRDVPLMEDDNTPPSEWPND